MILAVEDVVSERLARRMLAEPGVSFPSDVRVLALKGRTYLEARAADLNRTARMVPVLLLMDLDSHSACIPTEILRILGGPPSPRMNFRFAVVESESWVMADRHSFERYFGVRASRIPEEVDLIPDPKQLLVNLCRRYARTELRKDIVPFAGSTASVGPAYNARLTDFIENHWKPSRAADCSESLARAMKSL